MLQIATVAALAALTVSASVAAPRPHDPRAQNAAASAIPASSIARLEFAGLDACAAAADRLGLVGLLEPSAGVLRQRLTEWAATPSARLSRMLEELGFDRAKLSAVLGRPAAIGVGRLTLFGDAVLPSVAAVFEVGAEGAAAMTAVERVAARFEHTRGLVLSHESLGQDRCLRLVHPEQNGELVAVLGADLLIVSNSSDYAQACLAAARGAAPRMESSADAERPADATSLVRLTLDPRRLAALLPYQADKVGAALGVDVASRLVADFSIGADAARDSLRVRGGAPVGGLLAALFGAERGDHRVALSYAKDDALVVARGQLNTGAIHEAIDGLAAALPRSVHREVGKALRHAHSQIKRELEGLGGLAAALGEGAGQWTFVAPVPSPASPLPRGLCVVEGLDARAIAKSIGRLVRAAGLPIETVKLRDRFVYYTSVEAGLRYTPALAVDEGRLLLASDVRYLKAALARRDTGAADTLAAAEPATGLAAQSSTMVQIRLPQLAEVFWGPLRGMLRVAAAEATQYGIDFDPETLPETDEIVDALADCTIGFVPRADGFEVASESPIGCAGVLAIVGDVARDLLRDQRVH